MAMKVIGLLVVVNVLLAGYVFAADAVSANDAPEESLADVDEDAYRFPALKPVVSLSGGYRFVHLSGSPSAAEFEYLHDSLTFGGEAQVFSFPHRFSLELDFKNKKDYFSDIGYSFEDIFLFRGIIRSLYHNLDRVDLVDLNPATPSPGVAVFDPGRDYGVGVNMSTVFARLKAPDYPAHLYLEGSYYAKDGSQQQRSLLGSGYFNNIVRTAEKRDMDLRAWRLTVGANGHLGPVEVDYSHSEGRVDVGGDSQFFSNYGAAGFFPAGGTRIAGLYPHNFLPELKSSGNTIRMHTSYTGRLVASATLSKVDNENRDGGSTADYSVGAGEVTWVPLSNVAVFLKYRHREIDADAPSTVKAFPGLCSSSNNSLGTYSCAIKPAMSRTTDVVSGAVRYRPVSGVMIKAEYAYDSTRRKDADEWEMPDRSETGVFTVLADVRLLKRLKLGARYVHKDLNNPAYNTDPDKSDEGRISLQWVPVPRITTYLSYSLIGERRDDMGITESDGTVTEINDRKVTRDRLLWTISLLPFQNVTVSANYTYMHDKVEQDIEYHLPSGTPAIDPSVPYKTTSQSYGLAVDFRPREDIALSGGIEHTVGRGSFSPGVADLLQPVSVASFSAMKVKETSLRAGGEYRLKGGYAVGLQYRFSDISETFDNDSEDGQDGTAQTLMLSLSKRW